MKTFLFKDKAMPRWVILLADVFLVYVAFVFSFLLYFHFDTQILSLRHFLANSFLYCLISFVVFYTLKLHTGLLRYSNTHDFIIIISAVFLLNFLGVIGALLMSRIQISGLIYNSILTIFLVNFFISSTLLIGFRLLAKYVFRSLINNIQDSHRKVVRVLVYGDNDESVMIKQALESDRRSQYIVEGFITNGKNHLHNQVQRKKIYPMNCLKSLKENKKISELVIVNEGLGERDKHILLENCQELGIKVITVPPANNWLSGRLLVNQIRDLRIEDLLQRKPIEIDQTAVHEDIHDKKILITGAAGSIGSEIARQIAPYRPELLILCDQAESPLYELQLELAEKFTDTKFEIVLADVRNAERMDRLFNLFRPEIVYHAAAYKHVPLMELSPFEAVHTNVIGTKNVSEAAVKWGASKFVLISTDKAVNPANVMGASKRIAEMFCQTLNEHLVKEIGANKSARGTRFITTRFGNVLGSNGSVIPLFRRQIKKGGPVTVTHKEITRYFMTIPEAVKLVLEAGTMGEGGEIYVFDMGKPVKIDELAKKMIKLAYPEDQSSIKIIYTGLRSGEKLYEELLSDAELTRPTYNKKIHIAKVREYDYLEIRRSIQHLVSVCNTQENNAIVQEMKQIVPEYLSKNSSFQCLDKKGENLKNGVKVAHSIKLPNP